MNSALKLGFKQDNNLYYLGASYEFEKRFPKLAGLTTSLTFYKTAFDAIDGPTVSTNSQGNIDTRTFIADYKINKRLDTYLAYTDNKFSGDKYPDARFYSNVRATGAGFRIKF